MNSIWLHSHYNPISNLNFFPYVISYAAGHIIQARSSGVKFICLFTHTQLWHISSSHVSHMAVQSEATFEKNQFHVWFITTGPNLICKKIRFHVIYAVHTDIK